jgi:hypothetical protein
LFVEIILHVERAPVVLFDCAFVLVEGVITRAHCLIKSKFALLLLSMHDVPSFSSRDLSFRLLDLMLLPLFVLERRPARPGPALIKKERKKEKIDTRSRFCSKLHA